MKKMLLIIPLLVFLLIGCSQEKNEEKIVFDDSSQNEVTDMDDKSGNSANQKQNIKSEKDITIAIWEPNKIWLQINFPIMKYNKEFEKETGINVKFDIIKGDSYEDFIKKLNAKLYSKEGPTLIYFGETPYKIYQYNGVALNLKGKVSNLNSIYNSVKDKDNYFVPIGMSVDSEIIDKEELISLDLKKPSFNWKWKDYIALRDKWFEKNTVNININYIQEMYFPTVRKLDLFDIKNKKTTINTTEVKETINYLRNEFFSGKYKILKKFNQEDYYKIMFTSEQINPKYKALTERPPENYIFKGMNNLLYPSTTHNKIKDNKIVLPRVKYENRDILIGGFLVNKNGNNIKEGIEYLNNIISEEEQMKLYKSKKHFYPINKNIEDEIINIEKEEELHKEALELKNFILKKIKSGESKPRILYEDYTMNTYILSFNLYEDIFKIVFADKEYTDKELGRELKQLENQYTIWMNE